MDAGTRQGVLALGDSITNGGGELQWGVALQSWAQWTARGLGLPFANHAVDGARAADVACVQILRHERTFRRPDGPFDVGCLHIGANDVRARDFEPAAYAADVEQAVGWLAGRCDRVLACLLPLDLGRPRSVPRVRAANAAVREAAGTHGALLVDLEDFGARNHVMADHVHPTAFGQIAIAERALRVLAADGLQARLPPAALISWEATRSKRLRGDLTYAYRHAKVSARAAASRLRSSR